MILATTIQNKLEAVHGSLKYDFDVRYLSRWLNSYPGCFPKYILDGNFETYFNCDLLRWEIKKLNK